MYKFKSLRCPTCGSVVLNLPEAEVLKLQGMHIHCNNCGHHNRVSGFALSDLAAENAPLPQATLWEIALDF